MANRTKVLETLNEYFKAKGRVLKAQEYARETDTPIRLQQVRNVFGTWNKMEKLLMARDERIGSDQITDVDDVIAARNKSAWEAQQAWKAASENQDKKALREAEAQHVAEKLALNAATPEGANANKIAIGGPLPHEQPDFTSMGATVTIDPVTKEQTVVDPNPEIVTTVNDNPKTPAELKAAVAANGVSSTTPEVGHATDGGSTGQGSTATIAASGDAEDVKTPSLVKATSDKK
jgi:hypothetical protein